MDPFRVKSVRKIIELPDAIPPVRDLVFPESGPVQRSSGKNADPGKYQRVGGFKRTQIADAAADRLFRFAWTAEHDVGCDAGSCVQKSAADVRRFRKGEILADPPECLIGGGINPKFSGDHSAFAQQLNVSAVDAGRREKRRERNADPAFAHPFQQGAVFFRRIVECCIDKVEH